MNYHQKPTAAKVTLRPNRTKMESALAVLHPSGLVKVGYIDPNVEKFAPVCRTFDADSERVGLIGWLDEQNRRGMNIYFEASIPKRRSERKSKESALAFSVFAAVDCDPRKGESPADAKPRIYAKLKSGATPPPSYTYESGNGIVAVWLRDKPVALDTPEAIAACKSHNKELAEALGGKADGFDHCQSLDHLFRVPYSVNFPDAKKRELGRVPIMAGEFKGSADRRYSADALPSATVAPTVKTVELGALDQVDFETLDMPERIKQILRDGEAEGEVREDDSASAWRMVAITGMVLAGLSAEQVVAVVTDTNNTVGAHLVEKRNGNTKDAEALALSEYNKACQFVAEGRVDAADDFDAVADDDDKPGKPNPFKARTLAQIRAQPPVRWIVDDWMPEDSVFMFFGDSNAGKTFLTVSMGCCIATNRSFYGRRTVPGRVLHILGEGKGKLVLNRIDAWVKHTAGDDKALFKSLTDYVATNYQILDISVAVDDEKEVQNFLKANPGGWRMIFVDTVMRNFRGNINEQVDMAKFVAGCDRIRRQSKAVVLPIHHPGNSNKGRGMGTVNLPAALDGIAELRQEANGERVLEIKKLRDAAVALQPKMVFDLESVWLAKGVEPTPIDNIDFDEQTDFPAQNFDLAAKPPKPRDITSAVLIHKRNIELNGQVRQTTATKSDAFLLEMFERKPTEQRELVTETRDRFVVQRAVKTLRRKGYVEPVTLALTPAGVAKVGTLRPISAADDFDDEDE